MGETYAEVVLARKRRRLRHRHLLVNTGSTYSWIKADKLKRLGVRPEDEEEVETIEGRLVRRKLGQIEIECLGRRTPTWVFFATGLDSEVLGLHALEGLRLEVDPYRRRLKKVRAVKALTARPHVGRSPPRLLPRRDARGAGARGEHGEV